MDGTARRFEYVRERLSGRRDSISGADSVRSAYKWQPFEGSVGEGGGGVVYKYINIYVCIFTHVLPSGWRRMGVTYSMFHYGDGF